MKIALITDTYYAINGVSRTYQQMAEYCFKKNINLDIFTIGEDKKLTSHGSINIYQFAASWPVNYYYDLPPFDVKIISPGLKETFAKNKYDIIHLATPGSLGIAVRSMLAKDDTPIVGVFHTLLAEYAGNWTEKGLERFPEILKNQGASLAQAAVWQFLKWFYAKSNIVLAPSREIIKKIDILKKPTAIFPRGVDIEKFNPNFKTKQNKIPVALYVGRLSTEKNLDLLVEIFKNRKDCHLWLVGDGPYKAGLKAQLPKATFYGYLTGKELSKVYANADFFVFPSITDTFGNVILEAQASGLPVIVTDIGGPQELVSQGKNGLIAKPNYKSFDLAIKYLAKNTKKRCQMGKISRQQAIKKSWPKAFNKLFKIYKSIV